METHRKTGQPFVEVIGTDLLVRGKRAGLSGFVGASRNNWNANEMWIVDVKQIKNVGKTLNRGWILIRRSFHSHSSCSP